MRLPTDPKSCVFMSGTVACEAGSTRNTSIYSSISTYMHAPRPQLAAYQGFITVNWTKVHKFVIKDLDVNRDGHLDASDIKAVMASALAVLSQGVPSVGGYLGGFALGLR